MFFYFFFVINQKQSVIKNIRRMFSIYFYVTTIAPRNVNMMINACPNFTHLQTNMIKLLRYYVIAINTMVPSNHAHLDEPNHTVFSMSFFKRQMSLVIKSRFVRNLNIGKCASMLIFLFFRYVKSSPKHSSYCI